MAIKNDIAGWTPQLRDRKIEQLASVIAAMNTGLGPDLLGVCEVENRYVVDRLVDVVNATLPAPRNYAVVHADTNDAHGIDVAFIYDATLFQVPPPLRSPERAGRRAGAAASVFFHVVMRRHATCDILQVNFKTTTADARTWAVFGNHWPSRSGGQFESEGCGKSSLACSGSVPPCQAGQDGKGILEGPAMPQIGQDRATSVRSAMMMPLSSQAMVAGYRGVATSALRHTHSAYGLATPRQMR